MNRFLQTLYMDSEQPVFIGSDRFKGQDSNRGLPRQPVAPAMDYRLNKPNQRSLKC